MRNATIRTMRVTSTKLLAFPSRTLFLRLARPAGWNFLVGQYVKVCVPAISEAEYHPFTIASSTSSGEVELIIRVIESEGKGQVLRGKKNVDGTIVGGAATSAATTGHGATATASNPDAAPPAHAQGKFGTWTERVYNYFTDLSRTPDIAVHVRIEGPYGSVMQGAFSLPNVALLASGTGIVPMLSGESHGGGSGLRLVLLSRTCHAACVSCVFHRLSAPLLRAGSLICILYSFLPHCSSVSAALREFYASDKFSLRVRANEDALLMGDRDSDAANAPISASASAAASASGPSPASAFAPASAARAPIIGMAGRSASPLSSMDAPPRSVSPSTAAAGAAGVRAINVMVRPSSASSSSSSAAAGVSNATDAAASALGMRIDSVNVRRPSLVAPGPAEDAAAGAVGLLTSPQPQRGPTPPPVIVPSAMPAPAAPAMPPAAPALRAGRSSRSGSPAGGGGGSRSGSPVGSRRGSDAAAHLMSVTLETSFTPGVEIDVERRRRATQREWAAQRAAAAAAAVLGGAAGGASSRPVSATALAKAANRSVMSQRLLIAKSVQFTGPPDLRAAAGVPSHAHAHASGLGSIAESPETAGPAGSPTGSAVSLAEGGRATVDTLRALMDRRRESALYWRAATRFPLVFGLSIVLGVFQFTAIWLELSWRDAGLGLEPELIDGMTTAYTWPFTVLDILTAIAIAGFMALILAQPLLLSERSTSSLSTTLLRNAQSGPLILHLLAASAQAILLAASFGQPRVYSGLIFAVFEILRAYQMCFHYATNPLFLVAGPENAAAMRRGAAFLTGANLVWVNRDASAFLCLAEEMAAIADDIAATCGDDFMQVRGDGYVEDDDDIQSGFAYLLPLCGAAAHPIASALCALSASTPFHPLRCSHSLLRLQVRVYITGEVTAAERAAIAGIVEGSPLEGAVTFGRPDMPALLNGMCAQLAAPVPPRVGGVKEASADCGCFGGGNGGGGAGGSASSPRSPPFGASPAVSPTLAHTTSAFGPEGAGGAALLPRDPALNVLFCGSPGLAASVRESVMAARDTYKGRLVVAFGAETVFG